MDKNKGLHVSAATLDGLGRKRERSQTEEQVALHKRQLVRLSDKELESPTHARSPGARLLESLPVRHLTHLVP